MFLKLIYIYFRNEIVGFILNSGIVDFKYKISKFVSNVAFLRFLEI